MHRLVSITQENRMSVGPTEDATEDATQDANQESNEKPTADFSSDFSSSPNLHQPDSPSARFFDLTLDLLCVAGFDGYFKSLNPSWSRILGFSKEALMARPIVELIHPDDLERTASIMTGISAGDDAVAFENRLRTAQGDYRYLVWNATVSVEDTLIYAVARDVTDQKEQDSLFKRQAEELRQSEQHLREQATLLQTLLDSLGGGVIAADNTNGIFLFNPAAEQLLGLGETDTSPDEWPDVYGVFYEDGVTPFLPEEQPLVQAMNGNVVEGVTMFIRNPHVPDGTFINVNGRPLVDEAGHVWGGIVAFIDISSRIRDERMVKRYAAELQRSNDELRSFAHIASHDLSAPIRTIANYLDLFTRRYGKDVPESGLAFLERARLSTTHINMLIQDLLDYSSVDTSNKALVDVDLQSVLNKMLELLSSDISTTGAQITSDPMPVVKGDRGQLSQLLQNLLSNALKYRLADQAPQIHVGARQEANMWVFSVADDGIGIDPSYHEKVMQIFQRLHSRSDYAGTGIGLAICKRIVDRHGGTIWLESEAGQGATFFFTLPTLAAQPPAEAPS